jgi:hypothetical protein
MANTKGITEALITMEQIIITTGLITMERIITTGLITTDPTITTTMAKAATAKYTLLPALSVPT